jgi:hypothetical protein
MNGGARPGAATEALAPAQERRRPPRRSHGGAHSIEGTAAPAPVKERQRPPQRNNGGARPQGESRTSSAASSPPAP